MVTVFGVLLAAGRSTRFEGGNKLLATFEDEPLVRRAARTLSAARADPTVAVVGHESAAIQRAVVDLVDEVSHNPGVERGMSGSVRLGVAAARAKRSDGVLFLPGDMPCIAPETVDRLVVAFAADPTRVVIPEYDGRRGNPVIFPDESFDALESLRGDVGGRALFDGQRTQRIVVDDPGIHRDVDTEADLRALRQSGCGETRR